MRILLSAGQGERQALDGVSVIEGRQDEVPKTRFGKNSTTFAPTFGMTSRLFG